MNTETSDLLVIGSGIIGLTTAVRLQEAGFAPRIITRERPADTVSAVAGAVWFPFEAAPRKRILAWSQRTLEVYYDLLAVPEAGVGLTTFIELFDDPQPLEAWWRPAVRHYRRATPADLPTGYRDGFVAEVPRIETGRHLAYLVRRFEAGGGVFDVRPEGVERLADLAAPGRLVVNCAGLGARVLVPDPAVYPIRGQVVRVANPNGLDRSLTDDEGHLAVTYTIAHPNVVILGGTTEANQWDDTPDPAVTQSILDRAALLEPSLAGAEVLSVGVGLRPGRAAVRVEREPLGEDCVVIHNYGHGGSGYTVAWGCADDVANLVRAARRLQEGSSRLGSSEAAKSSRI